MYKIEDLYVGFEFIYMDNKTNIYRIENLISDKCDLRCLYDNTIILGFLNDRIIQHLNTKSYNENKPSIIEQFPIY